MDRCYVWLLGPMLSIAGCGTPRIDYFELPPAVPPVNCTGPSVHPNDPPPQVREGANLTVRACVSPLGTTLGTPTLTFQQNGTPSGNGRVTLNFKSAGAPGHLGQPPVESDPFVICGPQSESAAHCAQPDSMPNFTYGSSWLATITVPYSAVVGGQVQQTKGFTVAAPASCAAFDNPNSPNADWSINDGSSDGDNKFNYGSFDHMYPWTNNTGFADVRVHLTSDRSQNFPLVFFSPDGSVVPASAQFIIGGDTPATQQTFYQFLAQNAYGNNDWIASIVAQNMRAPGLVLHVKSEASIELKGKAFCAFNAQPCGTQLTNVTVNIRPGDWQTINLPFDTSSFPHAPNMPSSSSISRIQLLLRGSADDIGKKVWIDLVCPAP